jgi:amidase
MSDDLAFTDATEQADLVRRGDVKPSELVEAAIERIERVNPHVNAVIHATFERAREEAIRPGDGPFAGVPLLVKDLGCQTVGDPYHCGARFLKAMGYRADHDTFLARRFRRAGFVIVGRTNTPEFGTTITTEPMAYGASRNPWNLEHSTGGSSGGSAAAVAAGLVPVAHANDGGGSIRIPASECGLVGLKPSRGRVSPGPDVGESWMGSSIDGVLTRTVRDTAAALDSIAGYEVGDPYTAPGPVRPFASEVGVDPGSLRVGLLTAPLTPGIDGHPDCETAVVNTGKLLESLGHHVEHAHPAALEEAEFPRNFVNVVAASSAAEFSEWEAIVGRPLVEGDVEPDNLTYRAIGESLSAAQYLASVKWLHAYTRRMVSWWHEGGFDLLVSPVLAAPPPRLGWLTGPEGGRRVLPLLQYTSQFNVTGQPAVSLPLHWTPDGLPVGVQFVAAHFREDLLLRVAGQLEAAQPWAQRRPPVHA